MCLGKPSVWDFFLKIEFDAWLISSTIEPSLRPIVRFVVEIQRFVCDRATAPIEKLRSKGIAMHAYGVSAYLRVTRKSIKWTWAVPFEMNIKIEQELNFVVDIDSQLFLDAQEAKK